MLPRSCWVLQLFCATAGFLGWLGLGIPPEEMGVPPELGAPPEVGKPPHIPLEMTAGDDQFQTEATCWDLSPLDSCHHQPPTPPALAAPMGAEPCGHPRCRHVVAWLRSSCANLSEEEVNCQTSAEGHRTYPCAPNMEELQEELAEWLQPRLETPGHRRLQRPVPDETLVANEQHRVAQLLEDTSQQMERDLALLAQIEEMMEKLQQVNQSLGLMLAAVEDARSQLENHPQHLHAILDPAGAISTSILCGSCLVLLAMLLVLTPPHAILLHFFFLTSSTLSIPALSALLAFTMAGQWLVAAARRGAGGARLVFPQEEPGHWFTSTPDRECNMDLLREELDRMEMSCLQEPSCPEQPPAMAGDLPGLAGWVSPLPGSWRTKLSSCGAPLEPDMGTGKHWEPKRCSPTLASGMSLLSLRSPCQGVTRAGQRCRKKAIPGQDFCHIHTTGPASCSRLPTDSSPRV